MEKPFFSTCRVVQVLGYKADKALDDLRNSASTTGSGHVLKPKEFLERFLLCYWLNDLFTGFHSIFATLVYAENKPCRSRTNLTPEYLQCFNISTPRFYSTSENPVSTDHTQ